MKILKNDSKCHCGAYFGRMYKAHVVIKNTFTKRCRKVAWIFASPRPVKIDRIL